MQVSKRKPVRTPVVSMVFILLLLRVSHCQAALDVYGGDDRLTGTVTGYFHAEKISGRYYLVTPLGNVFWSVGPTTVGWGGQTALAIPYRSDLQVFRAKYADPANPSSDTLARDNWADTVRARFGEWGQNTVGGFSQNIAGYGDLTKVSETFRVMFVHGRFTSMGGKSVSLNRFPDVFDEPTWTNAVIADVTSDVLPYVTDTYRIGVYPDNEIDWSNRIDLSNHLAGAFFEDPTTPGKTHWIDNILKVKYGSIGALNTAWGTSYTSWDGAEATSFLNETVIPADSGTYAARKQDKIDFQRAVAEKYFQSISAVFRAVDSNHIFFSSRIGLFPGTYEPQWDDYNQVVWEEAGNYCDVIAINSYQDPQVLQGSYGYLEKVFQASRKPIMITEWHRHGDDGLQPILTVATTEVNQTRRTERAMEYTPGYFEVGTNNDPNDGLPAKFIMGLHWFQLYDEPPTGRFDGERWNCGLLTILDEAFLTLNRPYKDFWDQKYDYFINGTPIEQPEAPVPASPSEGAIVATCRPQLQWDPVSGAGSYEVLVSQTNYFGQEQCLLYAGITDTHVTPDVDLANGRWYWCVRTVNPSGVGGLYCDPASFQIRVEEVSDAGASFGFESLAGWRGRERGEAGGWGTSLARQDTAIVNDGSASLRVDFTGFTHNRLNGQDNVDAIEMSKVAGSISPPTGTAPAVGPYSSLPLAFADDFSDGDDFGWMFKSGDWLVTGGFEYRQNSTSIRGSRSGLISETTDAEYQVDIRIVSTVSSDYWAGVLLRRQEPDDGPFDSGYTVGLRQNGSVFIFNPVDGAIIEESGVVADTSIFNTFNVVTSGSTITVYINDTLWQSWTDPNSRFGSGYFGVTTHQTRSNFDNVAVYTTDPISALPEFETQQIAMEWCGGPLDFSSASSFSFAVYPFRMADQNGTRQPASRYVHVRMIDCVGGVVIDQPVDPTGAFNVEQWNTASFPIDATPRAEVETLEFYIDTGEYRFPLDQRLRIHFDSLSVPTSVGDPSQPELITRSFEDTFDADRLARWTSHHGVSGAVDGYAYLFAHRAGPALLLIAEKTVHDFSVTTTIAAMDDYDNRKAWIVFDYDPATANFYYAGFDAGNDRWEVGRYHNGSHILYITSVEDLQTNTDYEVTVDVTDGYVVLKSSGVTKITWDLHDQPLGNLGVACDHGRIRVDEFRMTSSDPSQTEMWEVYR